MAPGSADRPSHRDLAGRRKGPLCLVEYWADALRNPTRATFLDDVNDPTLNASELGRRFVERDIPVRGHVITRHRRGDCLCPADLRRRPDVSGA